MYLIKYNYYNLTQFFIDFDNNNFISSSRIGNPEYMEENEGRKKQGGFFGKVGSFFEKTATKIKEMQIGDKTKKILETSSKWVDQSSKKVIVRINTNNYLFLFIELTDCSECRAQDENFIRTRRKRNRETQWIL